MTFFVAVDRISKYMIPTLDLKCNRWTTVIPHIYLENMKDRAVEVETVIFCRVTNVKL